MSEHSIDQHSLSFFAQEFIEQLGQSAAFRIMRAVGGTRIDVPKKPRGKSRLCKKLSAADMTLLCANYGGTRPYIPKFAKIEKQIRNAEIRILRKDGASILDLSERFDLSERMIFTILEKDEV